MEVKTLQHFSCAYDLLMEDCDVEIMEALNDDERDFLRHVDDFDPVAYYLINGDTVVVCDSITGDIMGDPMNIMSFWEAMSYEYVCLCGGDDE